MDQEQINEHHYAYRIHQQNPGLPYLLMLHGFMGDHRVFDHLIPSLRDFCNPVTIDLLGFGESSKPLQAAYYKEQRQAKDLLQLIAKLQLSPLYLYGYSMGGRLALQVAVNSSTLLQGLILESTTCGITVEQQRKKRQESDRKRAQNILFNFRDFLLEWKKLPLFNPPFPTDEKRRNKYERIQAEQDPQALAVSLRGFGTGSMRPVCSDLPALSVPALILAGTADKKYMKIGLSLASQIPNGCFYALEAGHRIHLDNPPAVIKKLKHMINKEFL